MGVLGRDQSLGSSESKKTALGEAADSRGEGAKESLAPDSLCELRLERIADSNGLSPRTLETRVGRDSEQAFPQGAGR